MMNIYLKFEAKIPNGSKVVAFTRNYTKILSLKANLTLKVKIMVIIFSNPSETFRFLINSSSYKVKFEVVQYLTVKIKILEVRSPI